MIIILSIIHKTVDLNEIQSNGGKNNSGSDLIQGYKRKGHDMDGTGKKIKMNGETAESMG